MILKFLFLTVALLPIDKVVMDIKHEIEREEFFEEEDYRIACEYPDYFDL